MNEQMTEKEHLLWKQAKKRVEFRRHLFTYLIINGFIWAMWLFKMLGKDMDADGKAIEMHHLHHFYFPWPAIMSLSWGIGLAFSYYSAYIDNKYISVEKEYEKMKNSGK